MLYLAAGGAKLIGPVRIRIDATFEMPMSWSMKKRKATDGAWCEKKPDHDNISKIICDSLNGVAYHDDSSIAFATATKRWGQDSSVVVTISELSLDDIVRMACD